MSGWRLVVDAGGTNIRLGQSRAPGNVSGIDVVATADVDDLAAVITAYAGRFGPPDVMTEIFIAAAGPVENDAIVLTNAALTIDAPALRARMPETRVRLFNDLEAVALALPCLSEGQTVPLFQTADTLAGPRLVINLGTGFGGALLIDTPGGAVAVACEPGHATAPATDAVCNFLAGGERPSIEGILSGRALANPSVWRAWDQSDTGKCAPDAVAFSTASPETRAAFSALLGGVCGDLVLACGAWGGVYLCGSVAREWAKNADAEAFRNAFTEKGAMRARMHRVHVSHIVAQNPALIGLSAAQV